MEHVKELLDTSTIHGFSWISSTKRFAKMFWILVVIGGFTGAGYLIYTSFDDWAQSPITTTIETLSITRITFPNITICPPKTLSLNLNYDILQSEKKKLDKDKRENYFEQALTDFQDHFYNEMMTNLSKVDDPNKYYNWYQGYTKIAYPYFNHGREELNYNVETYATSGNISTQYFGEKFNSDKVDGHILILMKVYVPKSVKGDKNVTLMLDITKKTIWLNDEMKHNCKYIDDDLTHWSKNINPPLTSSCSTISFQRKNTRNMDDMMTGFRFIWNYDRQLKPETNYNSVTTMGFVR